MEMIQKVLGFDNYEIDMTDFFNVKVYSVNYYGKTNKREELKQGNNDNHPFVVLCNETGKRDFGLHQLVWRQFNGEIPDGYVVHHDNLNANDNRPENLILMTHSDHNKLHAKLRNEQGLFGAKKKKCLQFDKNGNLIKEWDSARDARRFYGHAVSDCLRGKNKTAYGFIWRYA